MKFEVTKTTNAKYKGYEVVKSVAVIASKEELVGCKDLTNTILNVVKDNIKSLRAYRFQIKSILRHNYFPVILARSTSR